MLTCISSNTFMNIAVGISAILTPIFAFVGFRQWRREALGKDKYKVSRETLRNIYKLHDSVIMARSKDWNKYRNFAEQIIGNDIEKRKSLYKELWTEYHDRIDKVVKYKDCLDENALDLEISGDKASSNLINKIVLHIATIVDQYNTFFSMQTNPEMQKDLANAGVLKGHEISELDKLLFSSGDDDSFNKELNQLISDCETLLRKNIL